MVCCILNELFPSSYQLYSQDTVRLSLEWMYKECHGTKRSFFYKLANSLSTSFTLIFLFEIHYPWHAGECKMSPRKTSWTSRYKAGCTRRVKESAELLYNSYELGCSENVLALPLMQPSLWSVNKRLSQEYMCHQQLSWKFMAIN